MAKNKGGKKGKHFESEETSGKKSGKKHRKQLVAEGARHKLIAENDRTLPPPKRKPVKELKALKPRQQEYMDCINRNTIAFGIGPAGTGKTYVVAAMAADKLMAGEIDQIVITRPIKTVDEDQGFVPGDLDEKFSIHLEPFWDSFYDRLGESFTKYLLAQGRIVAAPLGNMRGRTFKRSWVILDEAQNTTKGQMEMFLTRMGEGSKLIINGDLRQVDLERNVMSGLRDAARRLNDINSIGFVHFESTDSVRHGMLQEIIEAYAEP